MPIIQREWWGDRTETTRSAATARPPRRRAWRPGVEMLEQRLCLSTTVTVPGSDTVTIPLPALHAGDILTIRATSSSTDPNEDGEAEPLVIQSSDGRSTSFTNYNVPVTHTFQVATDGVTLTASFPSADDDDSAVLVVDVNRHDLLTQSERNALWNAGHALVMTGLATEVFVQQFGSQIESASPASTPYVSALAAGNGLTLLAGWMTEKAASDSPAADYTTPTTLSLPAHPTQTTDSGLSQAAANAFNLLATNESLIYGVSAALLTALNREAGAFQAGDTTSEMRQAQFVQQYATTLSTLLGAEAQYRTSLVNALAASPMPAQQIDPSDVERSEQWIVDEGLPNTLTPSLQATNVDAATVDSIRQLLIVQSIRSFGVSFPEILADPTYQSALTSAGQQLQPLTGPPSIQGSGYGAGYDAFVTTVFRETLGHNPTQYQLNVFARALATKTMQPLIFTQAIWFSPVHVTEIINHVAPSFGLARIYQDALHAMNTGQPVPMIVVKR